MKLRWIALEFASGSETTQAVAVYWYGMFCGCFVTPANEVSCGSQDGVGDKFNEKTE